MKYFVYISMGSLFGIVLTKAEVVSWFRIRDMFSFQDPHLFLIIGSAVVTGAIGVALLRKFAPKALTGESIHIPDKVFNKGYVIGGVIFGIGWAITGACPGPIFAQVGAGELPALVTLGGAILGTYFYSALRPRLPH
ncbi:MAG: transporter [Ectothiorhodospiraceae bacterium]|nr:transporter [Ectothiorhodospiraceae bacterium]